MKVGLEELQGLVAKELGRAGANDAMAQATARGGIVDEAALGAALKAGRLGGAAIDVFGAEPLPIAPHFQGCPNLILTPHVAGVTFEANERVSFLIADKVLEALAKLEAKS